MQPLNYRQIYRSLLAADKATKRDAVLIILAVMACCMLMFYLS